MQTIIRSFFNFASRSPRTEDRGADRFLEKSENFRLLLTANNKALELMAELSEDAGSNRVFGMSHVRAQSLKAAASVRQMIERLCHMAPDRYDSLREVFNTIVMDMEQTLSAPHHQGHGPLVMSLEDIRAINLSETGSKMALLGEIRAELGVNVPLGFSITATAFNRFMHETGLDDEIPRLIQISGGTDLADLKSLEESIGQAIDMAPLPGDLTDAMNARCMDLSEHNPRTRLAVRSSAVGEDSRDASFAGQFLTLLGVAPGNLHEAYRAVVASMYSATAILYRLNRGLRDDELVMPVACMEMVDAVAGGVIYTRSPMGDDQALLVNGMPGLPCGVVDGSDNVDSWLVNRNDFSIREQSVGHKRWRHILTPRGDIQRMPLDETERQSPCLSHGEVQRLAWLALRIEAHLGHPQDMEWALDRQGEMVILQTRPLAVLPEAEPLANHPASDEDASFVLLSGCTTACAGVAAGPLFKVESEQDMLDFPEGAVLLARNARPQLSSLLPRASALIVEFGSTIGHLANVAREFDCPSLIGAPGAMDTLSDLSGLSGVPGGGQVTVNAHTGTVYSGVRQHQLDIDDAPRSIPGSSQVVQVLERVLKHITPLNLTDPNGPDFTPEGCRTLHDITRFCHEMGVREMFKKTSLSSSRARRLKDQNALQYWLIDTGGGVADPGTGDSNQVGIEDVRSNAMLALWHGMTAIPWQGPPPASARGFLSVLATAAQNPALMPGASNDMAERNYFMVGRHYCNLQSRFGFHFATVEGFAGPDADENYALFQFQGGGADPARRCARAELLADILERHGFLTEVRDDALFARMENIPAGDVEQGLAIIGYLLVHSRQMDMAMSDPGAMDHYRNLFLTDIRTVISELTARQQGVTA